MASGLWEQLQQEKTGNDVSLATNVSVSGIGVSANPGRILDRNERLRLREQQRKDRLTKSAENSSNSNKSNAIGSHTNYSDALDDQIHDVEHRRNKNYEKKRMNFLQKQQTSRQQSNTNISFEPPRTTNLDNENTNILNTHIIANNDSGFSSNFHANIREVGTATALEPTIQQEKENGKGHNETEATMAVLRNKAINREFSPGLQPEPPIHARNRVDSNKFPSHDPIRGPGEIKNEKESQNNNILNIQNQSELKQAYAQDLKAQMEFRQNENDKLRREERVNAQNQLGIVFPSDTNQMSSQGSLNSSRFQNQVSQKTYAQDLDQQILEKKQREAKELSKAHRDLMYRNNSRVPATEISLNASLKDHISLNQQLQNETNSKQQYAYQLQQQIDAKKKMNTNMVSSAKEFPNFDAEWNRYRNTDRIKVSNQGYGKTDRIIASNQEQNHSSNFQQQILTNNQIYKHAEREKALNQQRQYAQDLHDQIMHKKMQAKQEQLLEQQRRAIQSANHFVLPPGSIDLERQYKAQQQEQYRKELQMQMFQKQQNQHNNTMAQAAIASVPVHVPQFDGRTHGVGLLPSSSSSLQGLHNMEKIERMEKIAAQNRYREELSKQQAEKELLRRIEQQRFNTQTAVATKPEHYSNSDSYPHAHTQFVAGGNLMNPLIAMQMKQSQPKLPMNPYPSAYEAPTKSREIPGHHENILDQSSAGVYRSPLTQINNNNIHSEYGHGQQPSKNSVWNSDVQDLIKPVHASTSTYQSSVTNPMSEAEIVRKKQKQQQNYQELSAQIELVRERKKREKEAAKRLEEEELARIERERKEIQEQFEAEQEARRKKEEHQKTLEAQIEEVKKRKERERNEQKRLEEEEEKRLHKDRMEIERKYSKSESIPIDTSRSRPNSVISSRSAASKNPTDSLSPPQVPKLKGTAHLFSSSPSRSNQESFRKSTPTIPSKKINCVEQINVQGNQSRVAKQFSPQQKNPNSVMKPYNQDPPYRIDEELRQNLRKQEEEVGRLKEQTRLQREEQNRAREELEKLRYLMTKQLQDRTRCRDNGYNQLYLDSDDEDVNMQGLCINEAWPSKTHESVNLTRKYHSSQHMGNDLTKFPHTQRENYDGVSPITDSYKHSFMYDRSQENYSPVGQLQDIFDVSLGKSLSSDSKFIYPNGRTFKLAEVLPKIEEGLSCNSLPTPALDTSKESSSKLEVKTVSDTIFDAKSPITDLKVHEVPRESKDDQLDAARSEATDFGLIFKRNEAKLKILKGIGRGDTIAEDQLDAFLEEFLSKSKGKISSENAQTSTTRTEIQSPGFSSDTDLSLDIDESLAGNTRWIPAPI